MVSGLVLESSAMESRRSFAPTRGTYRLHSHARMSRTPNFWGSKYGSDLRALDFNVSTNLEPQGIENDTNKRVSPGGITRRRTRKQEDLRRKLTRSRLDPLITGWVGALELYKKHLNYKGL